MFLEKKPTNNEEGIRLVKHIYEQCRFASTIHFDVIIIHVPNELHHYKTNKIACAPSEDLDQPELLPSLISLHCPLSGKLRTQGSFMCTVKTLSRLGESSLATFVVLQLKSSHMFFCLFPCEQSNFGA